MPTATRFPAIPRPVTISLGLILLWMLAFSLSCQISLVSIGTGEDHVQSIAAAILGQARRAVSGQFYLLADNYFHRGVGHTRTLAFDNSLFQRMQNTVTPRLHEHLNAKTIKEMLPWLQMAINLDPQNVETYLITAFWLASGADSPDAALSLLREAQQENPKEYRIPLEQGRILLREHRFTDAVAAFDAASAFWPSQLPPDGEDARYDKAAILLYRALLHEHAGNIDAAMRCLQDILTLYPQRQDLLHRLEQLQSGHTPSRLAEGMIHDTVATEDHERTACQRESDHVHGNGCGHEPGDVLPPEGVSDATHDGHEH